ncbi:MAG: efflux transporter outer membrane subunit [Pseudomonadota bacterium]
MSTFKSAFVIFAAGLSLTACASITTREEAGAAARASLPETPKAWAIAQEAVGDVEVGWIASFDDPVLTALVEEAQANNKNLQIAAANVERSAALARQAGAALQPSVNLVGGASEGGNIEAGGSNSSFSAGLQLDWELDVWGRIRSGRQAAAASAEAAEADYLFSQYSLAAGVARAYFIAIEAGLQEGVAQNTVDALAETARIVDVQYENGLASAQDVALTKSDFATARDTLTATSGAKRDAVRALEVLLGRYPGAELELRTALPDAPASPPPGVPSEILERRPDLVAAERNVAAAFNSLDSAKAARLPAISLTSNIGGASGSLSNLLDPANVAWTVAGNLAAPLFDGGLRQSQVDVSSAEQKQAIAAYGQAALEAFSDVESNLDQGVVLDERLGAVSEAAAEANEAYRVARLRYNEGETDLIDVLTIQQRVFTTESNLASVKRLLLEQRVNLNLALGGEY